MGNNFCVCDGDNTNEKESNIFSVIPRANNLPKEEEYKTLSIENKLTQGSNYKTFMDYNTSINNKLDNFLNEIYKTNNDSQKNENKLILETKKDDNNFNCSGKFNILPNCQTNNLTNGKTYRGIIDTRTGLVVFNTEETILTYVPFNSISMLAITSNHAYQICIIKKNGDSITIPSKEKTISKTLFTTL